LVGVNFQFVRFDFGPHERQCVNSVKHAAAMAASARPPVRRRASSGNPQSRTTDSASYCASESRRNGLKDQQI
jgi:hypothetical protein